MAWAVQFYYKIMILNRQFQIFFLLLVPSSALSVLASDDIVPPIPHYMVERIQESGHPFLLANRDHFREGRRALRDTPQARLGKEFRQRVESYLSEESPWYIGEGPLSEKKDYHPLFFSKKDFYFYTKLLCETAVYLGYEQERWAINALKDEVVYLIDELKSQVKLFEADENKQKLTAKREAFLFALTTMLYDLVYYRFDTKDRHLPNNQLKLLRDRLASVCQANRSKFTADEKLVYGTSLGLSTMFCISVYQFEWEKQASFSIQSFLPDLYHAVVMTHESLQHILTDNNSIQVPLAELESDLIITIPWLESLQPLGYNPNPFAGTFSSMVRALETHRIPDSVNVVHSYYDPPINHPWLPKTQPLFITIDPAMYPKDEKKIKNDNVGVASTPLPEPTIPNQDEADEPKVPTPKPRTIHELRAQILKENPQGRQLTLREQLEYLSFPRKPRPTIRPDSEKDTSPKSAGWTRPENINLTTLWGAVYQLAAREDPTSNALSVWDEWASEIDSHPYTYLFRTTHRPSNSIPSYRNDLIHTSDQSFSMHAMQTKRHQSLFVSQAALDTIITPTYTIHHDSFYLNDDGSDWRWLHEVPAGEALNPASATLSATGTERILSASPVHTPLYTCWRSFSPVGKTYLLRRHFGVAGGAYNAVIHFPTKSEKVGNISHVLFSLPENSAGMVDQDVREYLQIIPKEDDLYGSPKSFEEWQMLRHKERMGKIELSPPQKLQILFSSESLNNAELTDGVIGSLLDLELKNPLNPFFYILSPDQPGREQFRIKYASLPMPEIRVLEWNHGLEIIAVNPGGGIENPLVETDADIAVMVRENTWKRIYYMMINGTYLRVKFSPYERSSTLLVNTKGVPMNVAWVGRTLYTNIPPAKESVYHAPDVVAFECPGTEVRYGRKGRQAIVWDPSAQRRY